ncbi:MAG: hypothetical protein ACT4PE_14355 [Candidatus Eiseniibacteriota bacterium]
MRFSMPLLAAVLLGLAASAAAVETSTVPTESPGEAKPAPEGRALPDPRIFECGPIRSRDPEIRAQIRQLYRSRYDLEVSTQSRIDALVVSLSAEADPEVRLDLQTQAAGLKRELQLESMRFGMEIARLDGDAVRLAEYEKAMDHLLHPEAHRPASLDPAIAVERARSMGLVK